MARLQPHRVLRVTLALALYAILSITSTGLIPFSLAWLRYQISLSLESVCEYPWLFPSQDMKGLLQLENFKQSSAPATVVKRRNDEHHSRPPMAALVYLAQFDSKVRIQDLKMSLSTLYQHFLSWCSHYPVYVFYQSQHKSLLTNELISCLQSCVHNLQLSADSRFYGPVLQFYEISDFEAVPPFLNRSLLPELYIGRTMNYTMGYRYMCRFWAHGIFSQPSIAVLEYYWRFDSDLFLLRAIDYDPFKQMKSSKIGYIFGGTQEEDTWYAQGLWNATLEHMRAKQIHPQHMSFLAKDHDRDIRSMSIDEAVDALKGIGYNHYSLYNNFELSRVDMWRSREYEELFHSLDRAGGIFLHRWGDAPIRTLALFALTETFQNFSRTTFVAQQWRGLCYFHQGLLTT